MSKIVYIIPGFAEKAEDKKRYGKIVKFFEEKKFKVMPVKITWERKVMTDYVEQFLCSFKKNPGEKIYLFGFSFGAVISLLSSLKIKPEMLILCSLSPFFKEDIPLTKKSWKKIIGKKRIADFKKYSFNEIAKKIKCKTFLIAGDKEGLEIDRRIKIAEKLIKNGKLIISKGSKHNISQKEYINTIKEVVEKL
jgi:esterase/lipase